MEEPKAPKWYDESEIQQARWNGAFFEAGETESRGIARHLQLAFEKGHSVGWRKANEDLILQVSELTKQRDRARGFADDYLADLTRMQRRAEAAEAQVSGIKAAIERKRDTAKSVLNNEGFGCAGSVMGILNDILAECFREKRVSEPVKVCERCGGARPCRHGD